MGIIATATFKLAPLPDTGAALTAAFADLAAAIAAGRSLLAQVYAPQGMAVVNRPAARRLGLAADGPAAAYGLAFFAGRPRAVSRRLTDATKLLRDAGALSLDAGDNSDRQTLLRRLTDLGWAADTLPALGLKINLPPAAVGEFTAAVAAMAADEPWGLIADAGFGVAQLLRWGDMPGDDDAAAIAEIAAIREKARALGGTAVVEHCPRSVKERIDVWDGGNMGAGELAVMRRIKANFDPAGILNPGRFIGRL